MTNHVLEPAAQEFAEATAKPPFLYELGPEGARKVLDDVQSAAIDKPEVDAKWVSVPADIGDVQDVATGKLNEVHQRPGRRDLSPG